MLAGLAVSVVGAGDSSTIALGLSVLDGNLKAVGSEVGERRGPVAFGEISASSKRQVIRSGSAILMGDLSGVDGQ